MRNTKLDKEDEALRDEILAPYYTKGARWSGRGTDIIHFDGLPERDLRRLVNANLALEDDRQNYAPTLGELLVFMEAHPGRFLAHGYAVDAQREDCRVTLEGLRSGRDALNLYDMVDFLLLCGSADELEVSKETGYAYAWWD